MCSIAEDLRVDPWDIFTPDQEKPLKMLATQSKEMSEIADALIKKADSQEDFFSQTQETATNNLLFNLTMFTIVMMPPQFLTGVYGMNFEDGMWELKEGSNGYAILWGRCALHHISPRNHHCSHVSPSHLTCLVHSLVQHWGLVAERYTLLVLRQTIQTHEHHEALSVGSGLGG